MKYNTAPSSTMNAATPTPAPMPICLPVESPVPDCDVAVDDDEVVVDVLDILAALVGLDVLSVLNVLDVLEGLDMLAVVDDVLESDFWAKEEEDDVVLEGKSAALYRIDTP